MTGEIIPFETAFDKSYKYKMSNLCSKYVEYIKETCDYQIDLGRIVFFDENLKKVNMSDLVVNGNTYQVLVSDSVVRLYFDRTIRLCHDYNNLPGKAHLKIVNMDSNAYRYMYNEIEYAVYEDSVDEEYSYEKFRRVLEKYDLEPFSDNFDFRDLEEEDKNKLIKAYLKVYLGLNMEIDSITPMPVWGRMTSQWKE
jgi:hypothetical protein